MDSLIRHVPLFSILFIPLFIYTKGSLLTVLFICLPIVGELIQLNFPKEWMFSFEFQDIIYNFIGATFGGIICQTVKGVRKKQAARR